jgi:AraC family transcriptional regulator, arabinose operon regulatory protein
LGMGKIIVNMNDFTEKLFCSPIDAETAKSELKLNLSFKFVVGNYTPWLPYGKTNWRTMPFSLCCCPITKRDKILVQAKGRDEQVIGPGSAFFIPEGVSHNLTSLTGGKIIGLWIHFRLTIFQTFNVFDFFDVPYTFGGARAASIRHYLDTLVQLPRVLDLADSLRLQLAGMSLAGELLADAKLKPERMTGFRHLNRFRPVFERLDQIQPGKSFPSSTALAELVGLSQSRFLTLFHELTGGSPTRFIERKRHLKACELLLTTSQSITEIAATLRYADAFHFSRKFKQNAGVSPRAFRRAGS